MGLCSGEDRLDSTLNITRKVGIYSQTAGWGGQWMENYQEDTSGVREDSGERNLTRFLLKAGRGGQTSLGDGGGETPDQVLKVTRYGRWEIQAKLTWQDSCWNEIIQRWPYKSKRQGRPSWRRVQRGLTNKVDQRRLSPFVFGNVYPLRSNSFPSFCPPPPPQGGPPGAICSPLVHGPSNQIPQNLRFRRDDSWFKNHVHFN